MKSIRLNKGGKIVNNGKNMSSERMQHFRNQVGIMSKEPGKDFIMFVFSGEICSQ